MNHLTWEECLERWPLLARAMQWAAILSVSEAGCALRDYRDARTALAGSHPYGGDWPSSCDPRGWGQDMMRYGGGEAVSHYGGPKKLVENAFRMRAAARRAYGGTLRREVLAS